MLEEEKVVVEGRLDYPSELPLAGLAGQTKPLCQLQCPQIFLESCQSLDCKLEDKKRRPASLSLPWFIVHKLCLNFLTRKFILIPVWFPR